MLAEIISNVKFLTTNEDMLVSDSVHYVMKVGTHLMGFLKISHSQITVLMSSVMPTIKTKTT
jgi:hypothetical protein